MKVAITNLLALLNKALARWERYDKDAKQIRREDRHREITDDPTRVNAERFGPASGRVQSDTDKER
ncbi:hypothetical protein [Salinivibrio socompensis]|uniref:hypothetical protein n=1 Tax=Salinivibrio socompensis TaxID=1510206 RepID=UPI00046F160D|nr:hypothetical protein [Salinivibrio socompensis]